jgi:photosystem II stability/assembly factor-like uncharacterized protein
MKKIFLFFFVFAFINNGFCQIVKELATGTKTSLRGLSVVTDDIVWASGSNGTVAKSIDAGKTWKWITVKGFEKTDFRDIEAFDEKTAIIMGIDSPAYILKTIDGGDTWKTVYQNNTKGMFLDAMDFVNDKEGIVIGDPIDSLFFIAKTLDGGTTWGDFTKIYKLHASKGEAAFASSGTNILAIKDGKYFFVSGGLSSNIFQGFYKFSIPILQGKESTGANSIASNKNGLMITIGGDFTNKDSTNKNCFITKYSGKVWTKPKVGPSGYRSCVEYLYKRTWITCGLNGVDISYNNGKKFKKISDIGFHVCQKAKNGNKVFFAGGGGRIAELVNM